MPTSFISEHTAELILVPNIISQLQSFYPVITPVYHWASREGGIMSRESFAAKRIKVLSFYPRRPKVSFPGSGVVHVKLNEQLFQRSEYLISEGFASIAGVPLADKLEDIHLQTSCRWFELDPVCRDAVFQVELVTNSCSNNAPRSLNNQDIMALIERDTKMMNWQQAQTIIKNIGHNFQNRFHFWNRMSGDLYKPLYMILHID